MIQKIAIINGNPDLTKNNLNTYLSDLEQGFGKNGTSVVTHTLSEKEIRHCIGCFDCWWKTPGICRFSDDSDKMLSDIINSDLVIFASPLIMGMYSALLKRFHDRMIPLIHPYIEIVNGECHHRKRYPVYPKVGVLLENNDATPKEFENTRFIFDRIAINMHSEVKFFYSIQQRSPKEINNEISNF
ncbi:MAG: flavodoxin family protein [Bacteroidota bacterium]